MTVVDVGGARVKMVEDTVGGGGGAAAPGGPPGIYARASAYERRFSAQDAAATAGAAGAARVAEDLLAALMVAKDRSSPAAKRRLVARCWREMRDAPLCRALHELMREGDISPRQKCALVAGFVAALRATGAGDDAAPALLHWWLRDGGGDDAAAVFARRSLVCASRCAPYRRPSGTSRPSALLVFVKTTPAGRRSPVGASGLREDDANRPTLEESNEHLSPSPIGAGTRATASSGP